MLEQQSEPLAQSHKAGPDTTPGEASPRLTRNRNFNIYWLGQGLSAVGDSFAQIALPLLVLEATGSLLQMGLVTATMGVGQILSGLFAGQIVDAVDRRRLMIGCDIARTLLYATIPLCWLTLGPQLWLIFVITALGSVLGNLFSIASITAVTNLVDRNQILDANARLQATSGLAFFVGPMLAGVVSYNFGGPVAAIGIDAFSFVASFASLLFVRLRPMVGRLTRKEGSRGGELLAGLRFLWQQPVLRWVTILFGLSSVFNFAGLDLFIYHIKRDLGGDDNLVGIVLGVASIGGIISALVAPALRRRVGFGVSFIGATVLQGVALISLGLAPVALIFPCVIGFVFSDRVRGINSLTLRQEITPDYLLGRVTAVFWTLINALGPFGAAITTALASTYGAPWMLGVMGGAALVMAAFALLTPVRLAHPERVYAVED